MRAADLTSRSNADSKPKRCPKQMATTAVCGRRQPPRLLMDVPLETRRARCSTCTLCTLCTLYKAGSELLSVSMHRTKQTGSVASAITGSHSLWDRIVYHTTVNRRGELSSWPEATATTVDPFLEFLGVLAILGFTRLN
jgi:hypothetical protein